MPSVPVRREDLSIIRRCLKQYESDIRSFELIVQSVESALVYDPELDPIIHSSKRRVKAVSHLEDKLRRKAKTARDLNKPFVIDEANLYKHIQDLAGVRILYLRPEQAQILVPSVVDKLKALKYSIVDGPKAYVWDDETKKFFESFEIQTEPSDQLYTSVHIVAEANSSHHCCEIQIRTLMEEVWGEVSHSFNYPHQTPSVACNEQIRALAWTVAGGKRLVDSIFKSREEYEMLTQKSKKRVTK